MNRLVLAIVIAASLFLAGCSTREWDSGGPSPGHTGHLSDR